MPDSNGAADSSERPAVLVIDDEKAYTRVMSMVLGEYGFETYPVNSATEAWEMLKEITPDLVLLDVMMPEVDGISFLSEFRKRSEHRVIPVLVVTAYTETQEAAMNAGASGYLRKPFSAEQLRNSIGEFLKVNNPENPLFK